MPYVATDPRAQLSTAGTPVGIPRAATYRELGHSSPEEQLAHGSTTWWTRSQALLIGYSSARAGDELQVDDVEGVTRWKIHLFCRCRQTKRSVLSLSHTNRGRTTEQGP